MLFEFILYTISLIISTIGFLSIITYLFRNRKILTRVEIGIFLYFTIICGLIVITSSLKVASSREKDEDKKKSLEDKALTTFIMIGISVLCLASFLSGVNLNESSKGSIYPN